MSPSSDYATDGALALALRDAIDDHDRSRRGSRRVLESVRRDVVELLESSFDGWRPLFPNERSWRFSGPDGIHVYRAIDSEAAAASLHRAGFRRVTAHDHNPPIYGDGLTCKCETRIGDRPQVDPA